MFEQIGWVEALILVPFVVIFLWALIDVVRRPEERMRYLPKWAWVLIVILGNMIGQLAYLVLGRDNSKPVEPTSGADAEAARSAVDTLYGEPKGSR